MANRPPVPNVDLGLELGIKSWGKIVEIKHKLWTVGGFYHFSLIIPLRGGRILDYGDKSEHADGKHHRHDPEHPEGVKIEDAEFPGVVATALEFYERAGKILLECAAQAQAEGRRSGRAAAKYLEAHTHCRVMVTKLKSEINEQQKQENSNDKAN